MAVHGGYGQGDPFGNDLANANAYESSRNGRDVGGKQFTHILYECQYPKSEPKNAFKDMMNLFAFTCFMSKDYMHFMLCTLQFRVSSRELTRSKVLL